MKSFTLSCLLTSVLLITGCQSFQFVDSPIPVTAPSIQASAAQNHAQ